MTPARRYIRVARPRINHNHDRLSPHSPVSRRHRVGDPYASAVAVCDRAPDWARAAAIGVALNTHPTPSDRPPAGVGTRLFVTRPDGRRLEVIDAGPPDCVALVLCHGTPGSGLLFGGWAEACAARGVRLIGYSRPGYGGSTRQPERTAADCAGDVSAIADALGADSLLVAGHSGGGPHALACAALLPERVLAAAVIAGAAPLTASGLDWFADQHPENIAEFRAAQSGGAALVALLKQWRAELTATPSEAASEAEPTAAKDGGGAESFISEADRDATTPENAAFAAARRGHALRAGIWGWYDDDITETVPWGFDPAAITGPVSVWHGAPGPLRPARPRTLARRDDPPRAVAPTRRRGALFDPRGAARGRGQRPT